MMQINRFGFRRLALLALVVCSAGAAQQEDHYGALGIPRAASRREVKRAFRDLARAWHPDKLHAEGGAFEGVDPAEVDEADAVLAKERFVAINLASEVLSDPARRRAWDDSKDGCNPALLELLPIRGLQWGGGCDSRLLGCPGELNTAGTGPLLELGAVSSTAGCVLACDRHPSCLAWMFHFPAAAPATPVDGDEKESADSDSSVAWTGKCTGRTSLDWRPEKDENASSGFCPSAKKKNAEMQALPGRTSMAAVAQRILAAVPALLSTLLEDPRAIATLVAGVCGLLLFWRLQERWREKAQEGLVAQRDEYRAAEMKRIAEEVEERRRHKALEKELKRARWEAKELEETRRATEAEAQEVLLREKMQQNYARLEASKRDKLLAEKKAVAARQAAREQEQLEKALPSLCREVAREVGVRSDSVGNITTADGRRLGGMVERSQGTGGAEAGTGGVRGYAATSAQERLDAEVAAGGVMDEGARVEQQREEALAERNASRRREVERAEKNMPGVYRDALSGDFAADGPSPARNADPTGRFAGAAAASAAERREVAAEEGGGRAAEEERYAVERAEEAERAHTAKQAAIRNRDDAQRRALPELHRLAPGRVLGGGAGWRGVILRDAAGARADVSLIVDADETVDEVKTRAAASVSAKEGKEVRSGEVRLVFGGKELKDDQNLYQVMDTAKSAGGKFSAGGPQVIHMAIFRRSA